jgi:preflagellin peptidase FlaK
MILPLMVTSVAVVATLLYASLLDIRDRRVPFPTWYPMLAVSLPMVAWFYFSIFLEGGLPTVLYYLVLCGLFSAVFYLFAYFGLFGGADAWALIFLTICIPAFPLEPIGGFPPLGFLPFSVLVNAVVLNLFTPLGICIMNVVKGNHAPFPYPFLGFPVEGDSIEYSYGYIMEDIREVDGVISRRFLTIREALGGIISGEGRVYTKDLRQHPERYGEELGLYRKAGKIWISYGVPFIVPITAGLLSALVVGDLLLIVMMILTGG